MHSFVRFVAVGATCVLAVGCASSGQGATASGQAATTAAPVDRNLVTAQDLAVAGDVSLYAALEKVRPVFLRSRIGGGTTGVQSSGVSVYFDGMRMMEGIEHLRDLAARNIAEVRFLEPQQANARFGGSNSGGALVVISKK